MNFINIAEALLRLTGVGQIIMMVAVLPLPKWLNWEKETAKLGTLTRQIFWIYAAYILGTNLFIGGVTFFFAAELLKPSGLTNALLAFLLVYWGVRLGLQLFVIDKSKAPKGILFTVGGGLLTAVFALYTISYAFALALNFKP